MSIIINLKPSHKLNINEVTSLGYLTPKVQDLNGFIEEN